MKHGIRHVAIVGGGMTGLAAAYYLHKAHQQKNVPIRFTLIEANHRLGGKIKTEQKNGYIIETGPDSFLERKGHATDLANELGLASELVNNETGQAYIYHCGQLHAIPQGTVMGVPTELKSFLQTSLLSIPGKARGLEDLLLPVDTLPEDLSVGAFFRQRFGDEMVDQLIEPLVSGVYGNPIDSLSLAATYPHYKRLLQKHGSLIKGLKQLKNHPPQTQTGMFQTLRSGLSTLVDKIEQYLPKKAVIKNNELKQLIRNGGKYQLILKNGSMLHADAVIMTTPYPQTRKWLLPYLDVTQHEQTTPTSVATVAIGFNQQDVQIDQTGTGFIVPKQAGLHLTACTWLHKKWPHTTPANKALLRCFVGRPDDDQIVYASDEQIKEKVLQDLQQIKGIQVKNSPELIHVHRMKYARPAYPVGHKQWVEALFQKIQTALPQVYLAGSFYNGIGLPDCISQGKEVVEKVITEQNKLKQMSV